MLLGVVEGQSWPGEARGPVLGLPLHGQSLELAPHAGQWENSTCSCWLLEFPVLFGASVALAVTVGVSSAAPRSLTTWWSQACPLEPVPAFAVLCNMYIRLTPLMLMKIN